MSLSVSLRKAVFGTVCVVAVLLVFLGCSPKEVEEDGPVRIFGVVRGDEAENFREILAQFTENTGIAVEYEESAEFETQLLIQVQAGTPPDIAGLPQPGLMKRLASDGVLVPLWSKIEGMVDKNYASVWKDLGSYSGTPYGVFHRVNAKSFVWYPKKEFEKRGYKVPKTWSELIALSDQIKADGIAPWSVGLESGTATGWYATDWIEDVLLRTAGADVYDKWISHEIPFNSPEVLEAMNYTAQIFFPEGYVYGEIKSTPSLFFGDAAAPLFQDPPRAMLHKQGSFVISFLPDYVKQNIDEFLGVFPLPPIDPNRPESPMMGGGELYVAFNERPNVKAVMEFLTTWESGKYWASLGGSLFPYKDQDFSVYPTEIERVLVESVVNAAEFRFDGSDLMPPDVGNGSFWTGMVEWVLGKPSQEVLDDIEESWPTE